MGRGRAKAKQTKVARELKYASGPLDIGALTAELGHHDDELPSNGAAHEVDDAVEDELDADRWAGEVDESDETWDDESGEASS